MTRIEDSNNKVTGTFNSLNNNVSFVILTSLFFMWGFVACLNDILIPHLKNVFSLNYTQAMLVQFCFFSAYFLVSIPAGNIVQKIGYKKGMITGLCIAGTGCLTFYPAASFQSYPLFLFALFVLASGITFLQVSANPYVTLLGKAETASSRLTFTQGFNALGTTIAPFIGGAFILSAVVLGVEELATLTEAQQQLLKIDQANAVKGPYLFVASILFSLAAIFVLLKLPNLQRLASSEKSNTQDSNSQDSNSQDSNSNNTNSADNDLAKFKQNSIWRTPHLLLGALGIFTYVGAEVAIGSLIINFLGEENIVGFNPVKAANYVAYFWGGAMIGRFIGAVILRYVAANIILSVNAFVAVILVSVAVLADGQIAMWAILSVGLCNSIMFPTIFSLAVSGLGELTSKGSGLLCLCISGGAIIPMLQAILADFVGIQLAFVVPIICYLYILFYGVKGWKARASSH